MDLQERTRTPEEPAQAPDAGDSAADWRDKLLRVAAELDNVRKRTRRDIDAARRHERLTLLRAFLDVLDNFERALGAHGADGNEWLEGLEGIRRQMLELLAQWGARPMEAQGAPFDPRLHEAIAVAPIEGTPPGIVVETVKTGYAMDDGDVLRPAAVVVSA